MLPPLLCLSPLSITAYELLLVCRRPSRNTAGFYQVHAATHTNYTLPQQEILSLVDEHDIQLHPLITPSLSPLLFYLDVSNEKEISILPNIIRRCILTYGLFHVICSGPSIEETAVLAKSSISPSFSDPFNALWRVGVVEINHESSSPTSSCLNLERQTQIIQPFIPYFLDVVGLDSRKLLKQENGCPPAMLLEFFILIVNYSDASTSGQEKKRFFLSRRIAHGPAVGRGYTYASSPRRPRSGVLKWLADQHRTALVTSRTAMEPEIAWVMNNLARVERGKRVLDPFVGGGSLLLVSRLLGAEYLVGTDASKDLLGEKSVVRQRILKTFEEFDHILRQNETLSVLSSSHTSPVVPRLRLIDIFTWCQHPWVFQKNHYDAIVTDPPYSIKEIVRGHEEEERNYEKKREMVKCVVNTLLDMAAHVLYLGSSGRGRLVFFLPVWTNKSCVKELEKIPHEISKLPEGLRLVFASPQIFSTTFARWLVCVERCNTHEQRD